MNAAFRKEMAELEELEKLDEDLGTFKLKLTKEKFFLYIKDILS